MRRMLSTVFLLIGIFILSARPLAAQEWVYYLSRETNKEAKDSPIKGKIKSESPGGVVISAGKEDRTIPALDIVQICYTLPVKKIDPTDFRGAYGNVSRALDLDPRTKVKERHDFLAKALNVFNTMDARESPAAARYVQYRIAEIQFLLAMEEMAQRPMAIKIWEDYAAAYPGGWEILPTLKTLARLYEDSGDLEKARTALEKIADLPDVPKDMKRNSNVAVSQMLMRAKRYPDAEKRLTTVLETLPPGDPQRATTQLYLVLAQVAQKKTDGAEKQLKDAIGGSTDPLLRGIAYNALGDVYRGKGQTEEAFWAYLRVDAQYNLDPVEHAKAVYYLSELFKVKKFGVQTGDPVRANNYREKLLDRRFADSEYQKMVSK